MKILSVIFCLFSCSFCSYGNRDSVIKNTSFKIIPPVYKCDIRFNSQVVLNSKLNYNTWPQDMDLVEGIILSIGGTFLIPLCLDLYNERPISQLSVGGLAINANTVYYT